MVRPKPKSKRTPVRLRHNIEKASAAKQRKQRKLAKKVSYLSIQNVLGLDQYAYMAKNPQWRSRLKKDPGIPNLFPYKEKILQEIEEKKRVKEEEAIRKREEAKARREGGSEEEDGLETATEAQEAELIDADLVDDEMEEDESANPMAALVESARARAAEFDGLDGDDMDAMDEDGDESDDDEHMIGSAGAEAPSIPVAPLRKDVSRKAFDKVFKQVVEAADVILFVLDARDPEGTRSKEVERMIMAVDGAQKRLILILNKIDLVPSSVLKGWLLHLRRYFPTLPLRASGPANNAHTYNHRQLTIQNTSSTLFRALKAFAHSRQLKRSISVGVIGYPNVGKSSVINTLTSRLGGGASACPVGAEAGVTTSLREVKLDSKLKLLDSPGIVFPSAAEGPRSDEQARLVLLNAVPPKQIEDPLPAVSLLLRRLSSSPSLFQKLLDLYSLPPLMSSDGDPINDFLVQVARKRGRLGKGGVPNIHSAAMTVITDWRDGRIPGWIEPPTPQAVPPSSSSAGMVVQGIAPSTTLQDQKEIVNEWAKEFKLEGLWGDEIDEADVDETMQQ
ncbi:MAG: hypothetical protein M1816_002360 [Peltula sp. TS41687]|nr:MAG: hypothetical protein M1816_002360 [Peltula sp. TS41687]